MSAETDNHPQHQRGIRSNKAPHSTSDSRCTVNGDALPAQSAEVKTTHAVNNPLKEGNDRRGVYLLIDDTPQLYKTVITFLQTLPHIEYVCTVLDSGIELAFAQSFKMLLLNVKFASFPAPDKLALRHLIVTQNATLSYALQSLQSGVAGYMLTDNLTAATLFSGVMSVAAGGTYIDPLLTTQLIDPTSMLQAVAPPPVRISLDGADCTLLREVGLGLSNKQIALQHTITSKTISNRLSLLYQKIQVENRVEAAFYALQVGAVSITEVMHYIGKSS